MKIENLAVLTGPGVYLFRLDGEIAYVGATKQGLGRCLNGCHKMAKFFGDPALTLEFIPMANEFAAFDEEERLIAEHAPKFNSNQQDGHRRYKMRARHQRSKTKGWLITEQESLRALNAPGFE